MKKVKGANFEYFQEVDNVIEFYENYDIKNISSKITPTFDGSKPVSKKVKNELDYVVIGKLLTGNEANATNFDYNAAIFIDIEGESDKEGKQIDSITVDEITEVINKQLDGHQYILHNTANSSEMYARMRLIIPTSKPMNEGEYHATWDKIVDGLSVLPIDESSRDWYRIQGLPVFNGLGSDYFEYIDDGNLYAVEKARKRRKKKVPIGLVKPIKKDDFIAAMKLIVDKDYDNLEKESLYFTWFRVLATGVKRGEITEEMAYEGISLIGLGNSKYTKDNRKRMKYELRSIDKPRFRESNYTVRDKINAIPSMADDTTNPVKRIKAKDSYETMEKAFNHLKEIGESWRDEHTEFDSSGTPKKVPIMPHYTIANILSKHIYFLLIGNERDNARLFHFDIDEGIYVNSTGDLNQFIIQLEPRTNTHHWKNTVEYIKTIAAVKKPFSDPNIIPVNNGLYEVSSGNLKPFSPKYPIITKIETDYNPNAKLVTHKTKNGKKWNVDEWIASMVNDDKDTVKLIYQMFNEAFNSNRTRKAIGLFIGKSNSGKSTLSQLLINIIGIDKISSLKAEDFSNRFRLSQIVGKVANIGDDISSNYIGDVQDLMSVASGDPITVEYKNQQPFTITSKSFCLFSAEDMPRSNNKNDGWYNRLKIVQFPNGMSANEIVPEIKDDFIKRKDVKEYVLKKALEMKFDNFIETAASQERMNEYRKENDYIFSYISDEFLESKYADLVRIPTDFIKSRIQNYIYQNQSKQQLKYHFMTDVINYLEQITGNEYETVRRKTRLNEFEEFPEIESILNVNGKTKKTLGFLVKK